MRCLRLVVVGLVFSGMVGPGAGPFSSRRAAADSGPGEQAEEAGGAYSDYRSKQPDSYRYYWPNGLWRTWTAEQKLGRNTRWMYPSEDHEFYRIRGAF